MLQNAARFTAPEGTIGIRTDKPKSGVVRIACCDNGQGIDSGDLRRIFHPFKQAGRKVEAGYGGLGLGLAISKALIEAQNGSIMARSAGRGAGAVFEVTLPASSLSNAQPPAVHFPAVPPVSGHPGLRNAATTSGRSIDRDPSRENPLRILIVEDNTDTRVILERLFKRLGYQVDAASDAKTARDLAAATSFDLLISDIGLPDESGLELVRALHERQAIPAIALSGFGADSDVQKSLDAGFAEHLVKPVDFKILKEAIERLRPSQCPVS